MKEGYNSRQRKIYSDYSGFSKEKLLNIVDNSSKYEPEVIGVIQDILEEISGNMTASAVDLKRTLDDVPKGRHGCITAYLILMIVVNSIVSLTYILGSTIISDSLLGKIPAGVLVFVGFLSAINIYLAVLIMKFKKIGFYGFIITAIIAFLVNVSFGLPFGQSLLGLIGIAVLYGVLQVKQGEYSAWELLD